MKFLLFTLILGISFSLSAFDADNSSASYKRFKDSQRGYSYWKTHVGEWKKQEEAAEDLINERNAEDRKKAADDREKEEAEGYDVWDEDNNDFAGDLDENGDPVPLDFDHVNECTKVVASSAAIGTVLAILYKLKRLTPVGIFSSIALGASTVAAGTLEEAGINLNKSENQ